MQKNIYTRIAIVDPDKCKPSKCRGECKKSCPVVKNDKQCIVLSPISPIAYISEIMCIGCGICVKKCPYNAINIINIPSNLSNETMHRYSENSFKLHRLPLLRPGQVLGLVGSNGTGKSTTMKILSGKLIPNFGKFNKQTEYSEVLEHFRGSELHTYFTKLYQNGLKCVIKPQYIDQLPNVINGKVYEILKNKTDKLNLNEIMTEMDLNHVSDREINQLSGGELQRFAIANLLVQKADVYMFDEPSSYLDIKQRMKAAKFIRNLTSSNTYVLCVEHDLSVLDYLSDSICVLYGEPGTYGVVTMPFAVRDGINIFLEGIIPTENLRFRTEELTFNLGIDNEIKIDKQQHVHKYPYMKKVINDFKIEVNEGEFKDSEIIVMLGENGAGKTTTLRMLAGLLKPDNNENPIKMSVSYKPQKISPKFKGTVRELLNKRIPSAIIHSQFITDVIKPMKIEKIIDQELKFLSGGELQRVAITICLGTPADIYLIDEPSAYLDSEQRLITAKMIKHFIIHSKKTAFVVEHDFIMSTYLADRVMVFNGKPGLEMVAETPTDLLSGMNSFLENLEITFRRDPTNNRPRINKKDSVKDQEQKKSGNYFFTN